jgi:inner membrane protein
MDSLTHIVLGACIGEVLLDKNAGRKAMLWGALAQSVPDIDFVAGSWMPVSTELLAHRGITHSFLFAGVISFFLASIAARWHKAEPISLKKWFYFFLIEIACHLFLDACNNYGIGWFEPFSSTRISFNVIYVADPLFSILPALAFIFLIFLKTDHRHRLKWARVGIWGSVIYLSLACVNKYNIDNAVKKSMSSRGLSGNKYFTTPTLLNNLLWFIVIQDESGFEIVYRSIFDTAELLKLHHVDRNDSLLGSINDHKEVMELKQFSQGFYTLDKVGDTLIFNDLRFGQSSGIKNPDNKFAFHYYLSHPNDNHLVVQRGRFEGFNSEMVRVMWRKIKVD